MPLLSPSMDVVLQADHPDPANGGPCETCAFRRGTEANQTPHTMALARACVEGLRPFHCHERPQLCRGFIAAANLRGVPKTDEDRRRMHAARMVADVLGDAIALAVDTEREHRKGRA